MLGIDEGKRAYPFLILSSCGHLRCRPGQDFIYLIRKPHVVLTSKSFIDTLLIRRFPQKTNPLQLTSALLQQVSTPFPTLALRTSVLPFITSWDQLPFFFLPLSLLPAQYPSLQANQDVPVYVYPTRRSQAQACPSSCSRPWSSRQWPFLRCPSSRPLRRRTIL